MAKATNLTRLPRPRAASRSIQSIEIGFEIIRVLENRSGMLTLGEIARAVGMPGGNVHPYLVSFVNVGLVHQDGASGRYTLGPYAVQLGLAGIRQLDVFEASKAALLALREETGLSVYLSIWGNKGPAIIQRYDGQHEVPVAVRVGWVLPVLTSAMGQVCLAMLPRKVTRELVEQERQTYAKFAAMTKAEFARMVDQKVERVRKDGVATTESRIAEGYAAISAPILDHEGGLIAIVTVLGLGTCLAPEPTHPSAIKLLLTARKISAAMGYVSEN